MIQHIKQPNSYTCAVACVAMITGAPLDDLIAELRPTEKSGTRHKRMIHALKNRGIRCGDRFVSVRGKPLPDTAIVRISYKGNRRGHVVVKQGRTWLDPNLDAPFTGEPIRTVSGERVWVEGSRITSALWIGGETP